MSAPVTRHQLPVTPSSSPMHSTPSLKYRVSGFGLRRSRSAFTLIELLVVIAIIAILAGLAFPAIQGAMGSAKKAQARNEVAQLVAAVKAFQLEYGRLPSTTSGTDIVDADISKDIVTALTTSNSLNPRGVVFFEPKTAKGNKGGTGTDGKYYDPWGNAYTFSLDTDYDNKINKTNFTTVIVKSTGGSTTNTNSVISNIK